MCLGDHHKLKSGYQNLTRRQDPLTANHLMYEGSTITWNGFGLGWNNI